MVLWTWILASIPVQVADEAQCLREAVIAEHLESLLTLEQKARPGLQVRVKKQESLIRIRFESLADRAVFEKELSLDSECARQNETVAVIIAAWMNEYVPLEEREELPPVETPKLLQFSLYAGGGASFSSVDSNPWAGAGNLQMVAGLHESTWKWSASFLANTRRELALKTGKVIWNSYSLGFGAQQCLSQSNASAVCGTFEGLWVAYDLQGQGFGSDFRLWANIVGINIDVLWRLPSLPLSPWLKWMIRVYPIGIRSEVAGTSESAYLPSVESFLLAGISWDWAVFNRH